MGIEFYLIKPIQRICKYPLLFSDLLRHTPSAHPEHAQISSVLNRMLELTRQMDKENKRAENLCKKRELKEKFTDFSGKSELHIEGSEYIRDGEIYVSNLSSKRDHKIRRCYLFSNFFLVSEKKGNGKLRVKDVFNLRTTKIQDAESDEGLHTHKKALFFNFN